MGPNALFSFIRSSKRNALHPLPNIGALPPAVYRDYVGTVGRRAGALFFARHRDYFAVTRNFTAIYQDLLQLPSFTVTRSALWSTGTGKKQCTATQTAPNQTAGPLAKKCRTPQ
jgi:hypothetical protein